MINNILRKNGCASYVMFSDMSKEERDETMQKFRDGEISILITNYIARGVDVPCELVINFDVPYLKNSKGEVELNHQTYLRRIRKAGRFGSAGVALTIWDRDLDEQMFF